MTLLVRRVFLFLMIGWLLTFSGIAFLSSMSLEESQAQANLQGLRYWQEKIDQYLATGANLESTQTLDEILTTLKDAGQWRLDRSHLLDPYGQPYDLQFRNEQDWFIVSAGPDGIMNTADDMETVVSLGH